MSLYFGLPSTNRLSSPEFSSIGVNYRRIDKFSMLDIYGNKPSSLSMHHRTFLNCIPFSMASKALRNPVPIHGSGNLIDLKTQPLFADSNVHVSFVTTKPLDADIVASKNLIKKHPGGKYSHGYILNNKVKMSEIKGLLADIPMEDVVLQNGVSGRGLSVNGLLSLVTLSRLARLYLTSQVDPEDSIDDSSLDNGENWLHVCNVVEKTDLATDFQYNHVTEEYNMSAQGLADFGIVAEKEVWVLNNSGQSDATIFRTPDKYPPENGHCFPFVNGVLPADETFMKRLLFSHFSSVFHYEGSSAKLGIERIVSNIPAISKTYPGQVLLHVWFCISIGIETGSTVKVVRDSSENFLGCVIETKQPLWIGDNMVRPVLAESIRETLGSWMTGEKARDVVAACLSGWTLVARNSKTVVKGSAIGDFASLLVELIKRKRPDSLPSSVETALNFLRYEGKMQAADSDNISAALVRISKGELPSEGFVSAELMTNPDTVAVANLSVFGNKSISFVNPSGVKVNLYSSKSEDPLSRKKKKISVPQIVFAKKGKRAFKMEEEEVFSWDRLCVNRVPVKIAARDFETVKTTHRIFQVSSYDVKLIGNLDIHPLAGGDGKMLEALRLFGGVKSDFEDSNKRAKFEKAEIPGAGGEVIKKDASALNLEF